MTKIALIDLETTGRDPAKHAIIELACVIIDSGTLEIVDRYEARLKNLFPEQAEPRAYEVNGYTEELWKDAVEPKEALQRLASMTDYCTMLAYNVTFDWGFLKAAFDQYGIDCTMNYQRLDLLTLAWFSIPHLKLTSWKLKAVAEYLGVPPEPAIHRAMNGVLCEYEVLKKLRNVT